MAGRAEHGFPKLTNPHADGGCCKHLVRVMTDIQSSVGLRQRIAQMIDADRARVDSPGRAKPKIFLVAQAEAERMLPKNVRRIAIRPAQRGAALPKVASPADISRALATYSNRKDANSAAITRALAALLNHSQQRATQ